MITRRRSLTLALALVLLFMDAALAQTSSTTSSSTFNISWSALDPGDDWTWQMLQSVFPVSGTPPTNTGAAATLIGTLLGQITGLVMAIAMFFLCYLTIINIHRVSESAQILTGAMTSMAAVRIGFAAIMMFPLSSGFSVGQAGVMQVAGWGIGMARTLYANAVKAIGPDAMVIADPIIPGTRTIVLGLSRTNCAAASSTRRPPRPWFPPRPPLSSTAARAPSSPTPIRWRPETGPGLRHAARFRSPTRPPRRRRSEA